MALRQDAHPHLAVQLAIEVARESVHHRRFTTHREAQFYLPSVIRRAVAARRHMIECEARLRLLAGRKVHLRELDDVWGFEMREVAVCAELVVEAWAGDGREVRGVAL